MKASSSPRPLPLVRPLHAWTKLEPVRWSLCSSDRKLVGLLTDGDIRRAILKSRPLDDPCGSICSLEPIAALRPIASAEALRLMNRHDINHLPVVDADGVLHDLILRRDLGAEIDLERNRTAPSRKRRNFAHHLDC